MRQPKEAYRYALFASDVKVQMTCILSMLDNI